MNKLLIAVSLIVLLAGCSAPDEPTGETSPEREPQVAEAEQHPSASEEADFDSLETVRRERLREAMAQYRQEALEDDQMVNRRERLRGLREIGTAWWENEQVIAELALTDEQVATLGEAGETRLQATTAARRDLAEARRELSRAASEGDRERTEALTDQRARIQKRLQEAEEDWRRAVAAILDDDQLQQLDELYPHALERSP